MPVRTTALLPAIAGCTSWSEVHAKWASFTEKEKGDRFEDLTQAFLQLSPLYRSQLKSVWHLEEVPPAVRQKLKLPATDKGIDLVAETHKGEFWAIQCKYRQNTDQQLTHTEISTFTSLTFQACKGFSFALVCSTTERVTSLYRGEERIGFCALDTWQELDAEFFEQLRAKLTNKQAVLKPCSPRPHQENAIRDGLEHFAKGKTARGKLIMPCGTGKSLTAWFLAQALGSKSIVIAVPSLSLVKQTLKVWSRESAANDIDVDWICVCSDETAGKADQDDVVVQRQDIAVPCYTSTDKIAEWLGTKHKGLTVVFTTYQSGDVLATAARKAKFTFDLGIMDEAHKTVGDSDKQFSILLHDHNIEIGQRVFMTATERRYKGSSDKVLSMDNVEIYGDTFHQLSFKQAMEAEKPILCDYNVITIGVSRQEIKDLIKKNVFVRPTGGKWDEEMEADMLAAMVALRKAMKEHPIKHAVSFHGSIQRAELFKAHNDSFTQEFPEFGGLETFHVSGQTPTGTRSNIIKAFAKAERSLVTNARCLTEGVDVPGIDCVLFADPRKSTVDIVQAVGRALRPSEGKKLGYVILPVLHETDATSEQVIDSGAFKEILSTISALASNDDRIIEYFRGISQGRNPSGSSRVSFEWDERLAQNIDVAKLVNELEIKCWGRLAKLSWRPFEEARDYVRKLGIHGQKEWSSYCLGTSARFGEKPSDIPSTPEKVYKTDGWINLSDWLGHSSIFSRFSKSNPARDFQSARSFVQKLKIKGQKEWGDYCAGRLPGFDPKPDDIPSNPQKHYAKSGWISLGDWLGTGAVASSRKTWLSFSEARQFARNLGFNSVNQWVQLVKDKRLPDNIPSKPNGVYASEWQGWPDWLNTGNHRRQFLPFHDARAFVRALNLKSATEWSVYCKKGIEGKPQMPNNIPAGPWATYKGKGWIGMGDWLGTGNVAPFNIAYRSFDDARRFVHGLRLKNTAEWNMYCKGHLPNLPQKPQDIPATPGRSYATEGWISMGDWLGTGNIASTKRSIRPFNEAKNFVQKLNLTKSAEWRSYCAGEMPNKEPLPIDIPKAPQNVYLREWVSIADWLGSSGRRVIKSRFKSFEEARQYARSLNLNSYSDWMKIKHNLPRDIPATPDQIYKFKGWAGWGDWLGTNKLANRDRVWRSFHDARAFVRELNLKNSDDWVKYCKGLLTSKGQLPPDVPSNPHRNYKGAGWVGMADWLGTGGAPRKRKLS